MLKFILINNGSLWLLWASILLIIALIFILIFIFLFFASIRHLSMHFLTTMLDSSPCTAGHIWLILFSFFFNTLHLIFSELYNLNLLLLFSIFITRSFFLFLFLFLFWSSLFWVLFWLFLFFRSFFSRIKINYGAKNLFHFLLINQ